MPQKMLVVATDENENTSVKMMRRLLSFVYWLAFVNLVACHHKEHISEEKPKYLATSPLRKPMELTKDYVAQVRAIQHIELRALERGYLQEIFVDEGQQVKKAQRMFQIMPMIYQAEVQKAQAEADLKALELSNTKILADKNVVSPNELALAKAELNKAKAQLTLAATHQGLTEIRAPFDGIMGRFSARQGSLLNEGDLLTTLSDNRTVWVYFNISEAEYLDYKSRIQAPGAPLPTVRLVMANGELFDQVGKVETIEADFNNETGNIAFRATFLNPAGLLRHGETGKVRMNVQINDALVIPQKATFEILDKKFVFVVDEQGVVHSRSITIAAEMPQIYLVQTGLTESDKILVEGLRKVRDNSVVDIDYAEPTKVLANLEVPAE